MASWVPWKSAYLLRIMAFLIPLQLAGDVAYSLLARRMNFSKDAIWSMTSESAAAILAVVLAFAGFGVWALIIQLFAAALIRLVGLYAVSRYTPRLVMKPRRLIPLLGFSSGLMGSEIANFVTFQSPMVIIARYLGLADAGAYSASNRFASIPNQVVLSAVMGVLFPAFSRHDGRRQRRREALMFSTQVLTVILAPMMFGLWAVAEPAMLVIFGQNWAYAWPVLGLLALSKAILTPCSTFIPYLEGCRLWARAVLVRNDPRRRDHRCGLGCRGLWVAYRRDDLALHRQCSNVIAYSWAVFKASETPFLSGLYVSSRPMISAFVMALAVRYILQWTGDALRTHTCRCSSALLLAV